MNLRYTRRFVSSLRRLSSSDKTEVIHAIELFQEIPHDESLLNHALTGAMAGRRAFAAADDLRIAFFERGNYEDVILLNIGGHSEVYRR
jgi:mRNA-degrading endonuclease YafQ of YafQ-DinJ toxin-antitoxin module